MTKEQLEKGQEIAKQIDLLQKFANENLVPKKPDYLFFKRNVGRRSLPITVEGKVTCGGYRRECCIEASDRLSQRIMRAIVEELAELKKEFEDIGWED